MSLPLFSCLFAIAEQPLTSPSRQQARHALGALPHVLQASRLLRAEPRLGRPSIEAALQPVTLRLPRLRGSRQALLPPVEAEQIM